MRKPLQSFRVKLLVAMCFMAANFLGNAYASDIAIIANKATNLTSLTISEVRQVYMGGTLSRRYKAVSLPIDSPSRKHFNIDIIGLTESRIQSYWAQLLFTGRSDRPTELESVEAVVKFVAKESNAIAYVPFDTPLPSDVIVVLQR